MRIIPEGKISDTIADLCLEANLVLRKDIFSLLRAAYSKEAGKKAKHALKMLLENARIARKERLAICQDTGMPVVFAEMGGEAAIRGDLKRAINRGIQKGYKKGYLRNSIVGEPLLRGRAGYAPAVVHTDIVRGKKLKLTLLVKGFGCENKSRLRMFSPTAKIEQVKEFIVDAVRSAGADACPPYVVGVGIGGTAEYASLLAKKALLRKVKGKSLKVKGKLSKLEQDLLREINRLNIGPMGLGGRTTCLAVSILTYPTHIAGLPVAVNLNCHALRSAAAVI